MSAVQPWKLESSSLRLDGSVTDTSEVQPLKQLEEMLVSGPAKTTFSRTVLSNRLLSLVHSAGITSSVCFLPSSVRPQISVQIHTK